MSLSRRWALALLIVAGLLAGAGALGYAQWVRPARLADEALAREDPAGALAGYAAMETRFDRVPPAKQFLRADYTRALANQVALLYRLGRYEEAIDKAEASPAGADGRFWSGCALYAKALRDPRAEARVGWLTRAQDQFRQALEAMPDDWDTKYNYELTSRLLAELRRQPAAEPAQLLPLLRPPTTARPVRRVG